MKYVLTKAFEQKCVLLHAFLNQGDISYHCSFIGINDADFNSQCLSNAKRLYSETLSPKKHGQLSFDKKFIRMQAWFHLLQHLLTLPQLFTLGKQIFSIVK